MYKLPFYLKLKNTHFFISECFKANNNKRKPKMCVQIGGCSTSAYCTCLIPTPKLFGGYVPYKNQFYLRPPIWKCDKKNTLKAGCGSVFCVILHLLAAIPNTDLVKNIWSHRKLIKDSNVKKHTIKYNNNITCII